MAITTKPKAKEAQKEDEIAALINKGGSVAAADAKSSEKDQNVMLRIPVPLLEKLDAELNKGIIKKKRHPWILEAIVEKLQRCGALEL